MASETPRQGRRRAAKPSTSVAEVAVEQAETETETSITAGGKGRATPGRRQHEAEDSAPRGFFGRIVDYLQGVRAELNKVSWPTREQVIELTRNVLIVTVIAAIVLGLITFGFNELFAIGLQQPIVFIVFGAVVAGLTFFVINRRRSELS